MTVATAKGPVLVHMFDFSELHSVRTLPYLIEWDRKYSPLGLKVIGVQVPRFAFGSDPAAVEAGLDRLGVEFPVVIDENRILQTSYGFEGWPSLFLWGRGGILRWFHFGEGEYQGTEEAIQEALQAAGRAAPRPGQEAPEGLPEGLPDLPGLSEPVRETDAPGVEVAPPGEELVPGDGRPFTRADGGGFDIDYEDAGNAGHAGIHVTAAGSGTLMVAIDGEPLEPVSIDGPGLYVLAGRAVTGPHRISIELDGEPEIWSVSFAPTVKR
ncbi:MAG: hypothetical protein M3Y45_03010 [Actinomycetota bacterium]|nr:hypothetical protein [Actinomycetota bacterium]